MKNIYTNFAGFFRALKRNIFKFKYPRIYKKKDVLASYWFYTQKAVWSYTVLSELEERIIDNRLKEMCNVVFEEIGEVR